MDTIYPDLKDRADQVFATLVGRLTCEEVDKAGYEIKEFPDKIKSVMACYVESKEYVKSPIEKICAALLSCLKTDYGTYASHQPVISEKPGPTAAFYCQPRITVGDRTYTVDFLVRCHAGAEVFREIVIECDGHDFHERTKDQAKKDRSRDRALTNAGFTVLRFTGSELYREPYQCLEELESAITKAIDEAVQELLR